MRELSLLTPPYERVDWASDDVPALGALAIGAATSVARIAGELRPFLLRAPWCVPCVLVSPETANPEILSAIHALPGNPAFFLAPDGREALASTAARAARNRPLPAGWQLANYVASRIGRPQIRNTLTSLLAAASEDTPRRRTSPRTMRDRLRRIGPFTPRCWRNIGVLCRVGAGAAGEPIDVLAWRAGVDPRTLRAWTMRYLGSSPQDLRLLAGWEWILEAALRRGSYVSLSALGAWEAPARTAGRGPVVPPSMRTTGPWADRGRLAGGLRPDPGYAPRRPLPANR